VWWRPIGGALLQVSRGLPFVVDALSFLGSAICLSFVRSRFRGEPGDEQEAPRGSLRAEMATGIRWLWNHGALRLITVTAAGLRVAIFGIGLVAIVMARDLGASAAVIGVLFSALGIGGVIGALLAPRLKQWLGFGGLLLAVLWLQAALWALLAFSGGLIVIGVVLALFTISMPCFGIAARRFAGLRCLGCRPVGERVIRWRSAATGSTNDIKRGEHRLTVCALAWISRPHADRDPHATVPDSLCPVSHGMPLLGHGTAEFSWPALAGTYGIRPRRQASTWISSGSMRASTGRPLTSTSHASGFFSIMSCRDHSGSINEIRSVSMISRPLLVIVCCLMPSRRASSSVRRCGRWLGSARKFTRPIVYTMPARSAGHRALTARVVSGPVWRSTGDTTGHTPDQDARRRTRP
jgi:hypothetical protein